MMAGGRSTRMRATTGPSHKAMIEIGGSSLIEHNVRRLIAFGFREVVVVVARAEQDLQEYVGRHIVPIARAASASVEVCVETTPLGNIGFVGTIRDVDDVLVAYVDNLTSLDAGALLRYHRDNGHDLTIAVHEEALPIPYGVLEVHDGIVAAYDEKPTKRFLVSSGTCVVGRRARQIVPPGVRLDARDLFRLVSASGGTVGGYRHSAPWVDVNDADGIRRAEEMIRSHGGPSVWSAAS